MVSHTKKPRKIDPEQSKLYYLKNRERVLLNRHTDRYFKKISKELTHIMDYNDMLDTLRYIKKTYYVVTDL